MRRKESRVILRTTHYFLRPSFEHCLEKEVKISVEDALSVRGFRFGSVIFHHRVRVEDVGADLISPLCGFHLTTDIGNRRRVLLLSQMLELACQHAHGTLSVLYLAAFR